MPDTRHLFRQSDDAREDLAVLERHVAECKDACRAALLRLEEQTGYSGSQCYENILGEIDDWMGDASEQIRDRIEEADITIEDAEYERM